LLNHMTFREKIELRKLWQIEALEKEKEEMLVSVMEQLKAQNGENQYFIYKEIIDAKFEAMENSINGISSSRSYYAPNGGAAQYNRIADVTEMYYNVTQTNRLRDQSQYWSTWETISSAEIAAQLASAVFKVKFPTWLTYSIATITAVKLLQTYVNSEGWKRINNGTRCALYLSSKYEGQTTTVLTEWADVPYITIASDATNVTVKTF